MNRKLCLSVFAFFCVLAVNAEYAVFEPDCGKGAAVQEFSLDGWWKFIPADEGFFSAGSGQPAKADAVAEQVQQADLSEWHDLKTPQFLNETVWWANQSDNFNEMEKQRVDALPFDARNTWSGWYVREIKLPELKGNAPEVRINFEGIAMVSRVYCNGLPVGDHLGMFGEVDCRLTSHLKWGKVNRIAVYVRRGSDIESNENKVMGVAVTVPITSDMLNSLNHGMFGGFGREAKTKFMGIWQPVKLRIAPGPARIADVFFKPQLDAHEIEVTLENPGPGTVTGQLRYTLKDAETGAVLTEESPMTVELPAGAVKELTLEKSGLAPKLWSPDFPNLYELSVQWSVKGTASDEYQCKVGYRTVTTEGKRVYLNGKPYWVRGANHPPYGLRPTEPDVARRFLELMREGNTMVTRTHCNPWNRMWYELADEIGIGNTTEGVRPWALMGSAPPPPKALLEHWKQEQLEVTRQYRNHPSIMFYCIANEGLQGDYKNKVKTDIYKDIMDSMRAMDNTRPIFQTSGELDWNNDADLEDIHGYFGWYQQSAFVDDFSEEGYGLPKAERPRPYINQECAVGYNNTDTGGPMKAYIGAGMTEPWIGRLTDFGLEKDSLAVSAFQDHQMRNAKRTAEEYRWSRRELESAGVMLFANSTWITYVTTHEPEAWEPAPVWEGVKYSYEPVLVAFESPQYCFRSGQTVDTKIMVVNDDAQFRDFKAVKFESVIADKKGRVLAKFGQELGAVDYYAVKDYPFSVELPKVNTGGENMPAIWMLRLLDGEGNEISRNKYLISIADDEWMLGGGKTKLTIGFDGVSAPVAEHLKSIGNAKPLDELAGKADVIVAGYSAKLNSLDPLRHKLADGGRILLLGQGESVQDLCPEAFRSGFIPAKEFSPYEFVPGGMKDGARWTSDRKYVFKNVPEDLVGCGYLITRMEDKKYTTDHKEFLKFSLGEPATVYLAYDKRTKQNPEWAMNLGFERTELGIDTTAPSTGLICYRKEYPAGEVVLGGALRGGVGAMYSVIVKGTDKVSGVQVLTPEQRHKPETRKLTGEYVWMQGRADFETPLTDGLDWQDWKWWMRGSDEQATVCDAGHRIDTNKDNVLPIGRYLTSHFYWRGSIMSNLLREWSWPVFAVQYDWGEVLVSELTIESALPFDSRAARTLSNFVKQPLK